MKIVIKKIDLINVSINEIERLFGARPIDEIQYSPSSELTKQLDSVVFEVDSKQEARLTKYLIDRLVAVRII